MLQRNWTRIALLILTGMIVQGCGILSPPKTFEASDFVGTWQAEYTDVMTWSGERVFGIERLTLKADGTYQQVYDDGKGYVYTSPWNKWHLKRLSNGRTQIHLRGGRYYPSGIQTAENYARGRSLMFLYDPATDKTVDLGGDVILNVEVYSDTPQGLNLVHLPGNLDHW
jgi:hypothetical protein